MHTKTPKNSCDLDLWPLKCNSVIDVVEVHASARFRQAQCSGYQQCTRVHSDNSSLDFDREYLTNGASNGQSENGVLNYDCFQFGKMNLMNCDPLINMTVTFESLQQVVQQLHITAGCSSGVSNKGLMSKFCQEGWFVVDFLNNANILQRPVKCRWAIRLMHVATSRFVSLDDETILYILHCSAHFPC